MLRLITIKIQTSAASECDLWPLRGKWYQVHAPLKAPPKLSQLGNSQTSFTIDESQGCCAVNPGYQSGFSLQWTNQVQCKPASSFASCCEQWNPKSYWLKVSKLLYCYVLDRNTINASRKETHYPRLLVQLKEVSILSFWLFFFFAGYFVIWSITFRQDRNFICSFSDDLIR